MRDDHRFDALFQAAAVEHGLDWLLLKAQAMAESNLDPKAVSGVGAQGIAQFMPATWQEWGAREGLIGDPFDPADAVPAQARYLSWLIGQCDGDVRAALAAYNWGIGRIRRHLREYGRLELAKLPQETRGYIERIERFHTELASVHKIVFTTQRSKGGTNMDQTARQQAEAKHVFESKTFWVNAVAGVLALGLNLLGVPIPGDVVVATVATTLVNIGLRFITKQPVKL